MYIFAQATSILSVERAAWSRSFILRRECQMCSRSASEHECSREF